MEEVLVPIFGMLVPMVMFISIFTFLALAKRAEERRKEEEARARYDFLRKMAEGGSLDVQKYVEFERAEQHFKRQRRIENMNLGGLVLVAVGVASIPFFYVVDESFGGWLATLGLTPLLVGLALALAARWMSRAGGAGA